MQKREAHGLLERFTECTPSAVVTKIEKTNIGIGMVLHFLSKMGRPVSAGEISRRLNISTARVAVLLRTMSEKGLIERSADPSDGRKVRISLSEAGRERDRRTTEELDAILEKILEKVGRERLEQFFAVADEIRDIVIETAKKNGQSEKPQK